MTVTPEVDAPRPASGDSFSDAVTIAFADDHAGIYGTARLGLAGGTTPSGLVILFQGADLAAVAAESGDPVATAPERWDDVQASGLDVETVEPLRAWRLHFAGENASFDLEVEAAGAIGELPDGDPLARAGGMYGFEQPVRVRGAAEAGGRRMTIDGLGQRGRSWGAPDWDRIARTRTLGAWFDDVAVSLAAIRPQREDAHGREAIGAMIFENGEEDGAPAVVHVEDPRLSTTYDADGRQRRAALELWITDEGPPRRASGEVVCGTTLDLGRLRLDCAFLRWRLEGRTGIGRYDVLRRAA